MARPRFSLVTLFVVLTGMAMVAGSWPVLRLADVRTLLIGGILAAAAAIIAVIVHVRNRYRQD
jgi:hypothetical protein